MTEVDPLEQMLEQARAALAPSLGDDAHLRRALGLPPAGALPSAGELPAAERVASSSTVAERAAAPRAGVLDPRAWHALRASGSAGLLAGVMLAGFGFGAGVWLGNAGFGKEGALTEPPAVIAPADAAGRSPPPAPGSDPRPAPLFDVGDRRTTGGANPSAEMPRAAARGEPEALPEPNPAHADRASPREEPPPRAKSSARRDPRPPSRAHATAPSAASEELALLRRVERALRAQNPALALALVAELDQRFPDTRLGEEREAARVIASCGMSEGGARLRAERFVREHGGSVYAERVREACAIPEKATGSEGTPPLGDE